MTVAPPEAIAARLADFLCARRERLMRDWVDAAHRDSQIEASEAVGARALRNHMPQLFDDLAEVLRTGAGPEAKQHAKEDALAHGPPPLGTGV